MNVNSGLCTLSSVTVDDTETVLLEYETFNRS